MADTPMNEHSLPEDLSRWPDNPFELLGVRPGLSERELRRAYVRLIRIYKPEQFPEHFRRIREAYETAQRYASFYPAFQVPEDLSAGPAEETSPAPEIVEPDRLGDAGAAGEDYPPTQKPPPSLDEVLDDVWDRVIAGDEEQAYARLLELQNQYRPHSEICLRLYCLLQAAPELDPHRSPCDFLVQGLRQTGGSGPCHELYRREIEDRPNEALSDRFRELLHAIVEPGLLASFVKYRWSAAGKLERFEVIGDDLPDLRARLAGEQEEIWLRLLLAAADQLAWAPAADNVLGFSNCLNEANQCKHLQLSCADVFDRLDFLKAAAAGWHALNRKGRVSPKLLQLLSSFWARPFPEIRPRVRALLAGIALRTDEWLTQLDRINKVCPLLLSLFGQMLDSYEWTLDLDVDERDPKDLSLLARHFLEGQTSQRNYGTLRRELLAFCVRDLIHPDQVIEQALSGAVILADGQLGKLTDDWPLRHVYRACTLIRS